MTFNFSSLLLIFISGAIFAQGTSGQTKDAASPFANGIRLFQEQRWDDAGSEFQKVVEGDPTLKDYALFYLGQIDFQQNQFGAALQKWKDALNSKPTALFRRDVTLFQARANLGLKKKDKAIDIANHLWKKNKRFRPVLDFLVENEKTDKRRCVYQIQIWKIDTTYELPETSKCAPNFADVKDRLKKFQALGQGQVALEVFRKRWEKNLKADEWIDLTAQTLVADGELDAAATLLEPRKDASFASALALGIIYGRRGDTDKAGAIFAELENKKLSGKQKELLIFQRAFLSYQVRNYDLAAEQFAKYQKYGHGHDVKDLSRWYAAWIEYLRGRYEQAKGHFRELALLPRWNVQSIYWLAMSHYRLNETAQAKLLFDMLASSDSVPGFYRVLASQRSHGLVLPDQSYVVANDVNFESSFRERIILPPVESEKVTLLEHDEEPDSIASVAASADPTANGGDAVANNADADSTAGAENADAEVKNLPVSIAKIRILEDVGLTDYAQAELRRSKTDFRDSGIYLHELEKLGCYDASTLLSRDMLSRGGARHSELDRFAYPKPFSDAVVASSTQFKIPQQLIWSIMYAESRFQPKIISPVGARGLMQLMPFTAEKVSSLLGLKGFAPETLSDPATSIRIGTRYMQKLDREFDHQVPLMIAAYNAGPHRVQSWLYYLSSLEMDEFIEHIPYSETRAYVKKVLSYIDAYARIYAQPFDFAGMTNVARMSSERKLVLKESWTESGVNGI